MPQTLCSTFAVACSQLVLIVTRLGSRFTILKSQSGFGYGDEVTQDFSRFT